jgi:hypothetical protein
MKILFYYTTKENLNTCVDLIEYARKYDVNFKEYYITGHISPDIVEEVDAVVLADHYSVELLTGTRVIIINREKEDVPRGCIGLLGDPRRNFVALVKDINLADFYLETAGRLLIKGE